MILEINKLHKAEVQLRLTQAESVRLNLYFDNEGRLTLRDPLYVPGGKVKITNFYFCIFIPQNTKLFHNQFKGAYL